MKALLPFSAALVVAGILPSSALGSSGTYTGPRWTLDTGQATACSRIVIGDVTPGFDLDAVLLFGGQAVLANAPGTFEAFGPIRDGVSDLAMLHTASGDLLVMATSAGLESTTATVSGESLISFSHTVLSSQPSEQLKVVELDAAGTEGLASFTGNVVRIYAASGGGLQQVLSVTLPSYLTIQDVELADTHPAVAGREVHLLAGSVLYVLPWGSATPIEARATGGVAPVVDSTRRSAYGPELVLYHTWDATLGASVLHMYGQPGAAYAPIDLQGLPLTSVVAGTDWSSPASESLLLVSSEVGVMEQVTPETYFATGAEFEAWDGGEYGDVVDVPGGGPVQAAAGDVDGDGDEDLLYVSADGSELHVVPGVRVAAEDLRLTLDYMEFRSTNLGGYGIYIVPAGHVLGSSTPVLPPGMEEMEVTIWYQSDSQSWMQPTPVFQEYRSYGPDSYEPFDRPFSSPGGNDQIFHVRLRAVLRVNGSVVAVAPSRMQFGTFVEGDGGGGTGPPALPAGWINTITEWRGDPDTTGTWRGTGGGPPPPAGQP